MSQDDDAPLPLADGEDLEPIALEEGAEGQAQRSSRIQAFGSHAAAAAGRKQEFRRGVNLTGAGATRVRFFHSKLTLAAIEHMIAQINEWLDGEEVEVKSINQVVGVIEGKKPEPAIIVTVWY